MKNMDCNKCPMGRKKLGNEYKGCMVCPKREVKPVEQVEDTENTEGEVKN